ncbi:TPA: hypothetical protein QCO21_004542 [Bacillus cereus]|nr:hypothetical protein [Bacillus cereus]
MNFFRKNKLSDIQKKYYEHFGEQIQFVNYYSRGSVMYFQTDDTLYYVNLLNV